MTQGARALLAVVAAGLVSAGCSGGSKAPADLECQAGQHACGDACVPDTSPLTCGARCEACPGTANGSATCAAGACGLTCLAGAEPCVTGCCLVAPPPGSVQVSFAWPGSGQPFATAARLEVILPDRTEVLAAPATALTVTGLAPGLARFRLRLLDGPGQVLARGGGVLEVGSSEVASLPISTDVASLSACALVDTTPEEDLAVDVSERRTLTVGARAGRAALLLGPVDLAWSVAGADVASVDPITGEVSPTAPGFTTITVHCGYEEPSYRLAAAGAATAAGAPAGPLSASVVLFVRDRTSGNAAPVARVTVDPTAADSDFTFRLDASTTSDDGPATALRWRFDWEGDGTWDTAFGTRSVGFHRFGWAATFAPVVQVVDGGGLTSRASLSLPVAAPTGVRVSIDPQSHLLWLIAPGQPWFTATVTGAADTSVTWSLLEGAADVAGSCLMSTASTCLYDPPRTGGYYHLVATANANPTKRAMAEIEVRNQAPAADCHVEVGIGVWTDWAILGQEVRAQGSLSRDPEGGPLAFHWWYQQGTDLTRLDLPGTGSSLMVGSDLVGARTIGLDVTDMGGEVGSNRCGTVTWGPARGSPMGSSVGAAFWDDPDMTIEYAFSAGATSYGMASCSYSAAGACWRRDSSDTCVIEAVGLGAPYLACASGRWFVIGPESGVPHLWAGDLFYGWWPVQNARGAGLSQVEVATRGHSCLAGPFCP